MGHILSSIFLALIAVVIGLEIQNVELIELIRGKLAAWLLIIFGLIYTLYGLKFLFGKYHSHINEPHFREIHDAHQNKHQDAKSLTPWILFIIFVFGPCEPLIPLVMYPALKNNWTNLVIISSVFSIVTILTMIGIILILYYGLNKIIKLERYEKYSHFIAGLIILICGLAIEFLGL